MREQGFDPRLAPQRELLAKIAQLNVSPVDYGAPLAHQQLLGDAICLRLKYHVGTRRGWGFQRDLVASAPSASAALRSPITRLGRVFLLDRRDFSVLGRHIGTVALLPLWREIDRRKLRHYQSMIGATDWQFGLAHLETADAGVMIGDAPRLFEHLNGAHAFSDFTEHIGAYVLRRVALCFESRQWMRWTARAAIPRPLVIALRIQLDAARCRAFVEEQLIPETLPGKQWLICENPDA